MSFYERGSVRLHYEEAGSSFPLLLIAGGGLNSTISGLTRADPFNPIEEFKGEYRCIASDLRNANGGQSSGPLEVDRPWDAYTDDHLDLMDHLGIEKFMVLGFCTIHKSPAFSPARASQALAKSSAAGEKGHAGGVSRSPVMRATFRPNGVAGGPVRPMACRRRAASQRWCIPRLP
jgi:hypothetical protein